MNSKASKDYIIQLAKEENLSGEEIENIVFSPFKVTSEKMKDIKEYNFPTIYIMKFGTFYVTPWAKEYWKKRNEEKNI